MTDSQKHLDMNRTAWDTAHPDLRNRRRSDWADDIRRGESGRPPTEVSLMGDVCGLDVMQLSCAGDATQAFWLANEGARVTACDFSPNAIDIAREHAADFGIDITFVVDDSQRLTTQADASFDWVHADYNTSYYEDLPLACRNWYRVLRPGGRLILHETHPMMNCMDWQGDPPRLAVLRSYFDKSPEYYDFHIKGLQYDLPAVEFHKTLADLVNTVVDAGFLLRRMEEPPGDEHGRYGFDGLPADVYLITQKPG
jgi:ubiquinone/menaquinone biosynthesis C-methylase UbiE